MMNYEDPIGIIEIGNIKIKAIIFKINSEKIEVLSTSIIASEGIHNDVAIAQTIIGAVAVILIGFTFLPLGATPASIRKCQLNADQKLLKYLGVVVVIMTSLSAIFYLEILRLYGLIGI